MRETNLRQSISVTGSASSQPFKLRAYLELFRLPNVFTAMADVMMGFLVTQGSLEPPLHFWLLLIASSLIYTAGMVLNDVYDFNVDLLERPSRPLPSGRIDARSAKWLGFALLGLGIVAAIVVSLLIKDVLPALTAVALAVVVVLYDRVLKKTPLGPVAMGTCRMLNVLLGMSAAATGWEPYHWMIAGGIGTYIVGVTWFARTEAAVSSRPQLALAAMVVLAGLALLALFPDVMSAKQRAILEWQGPDRWRLLWIMLAVLIGWRLVKAIADPSPQPVQFAIKQSILSLIILDAAVAFAFAGLFWSIMILILLIPAMLLGQWIYST